MRSKVRTFIGLAAILPAVFLLFSASLASASQAGLINVQNMIRQNGARWTAGETSISKLSEVERLRRVGWIEAPPVNSSSPSAAAASPLVGASLPASLDYRNCNGVDYVTPIRDQGSCGDCWAFASTAALESYVLSQNPQIQAGDLDLSEQVLLSCSGAGNCDGGSDNTAADYIQNVGLPPEASFPYTDTQQSCSSAATQDWESQTYKISSWRQITGQYGTVNDLKDALYTYGPLVTTMEVYSDFYYYTGGVYSYTKGTAQGEHAIELIGYDDNQQCFICKNSWGTGWGENGFFEIAYSQVGGATVNFGQYSLAYGAGINLTSGGLWQNAIDEQNGWKYLSWFGYFSTNSSPLIYHQTLGWLYPEGTSTDSLWFYDYQWDGRGGWWWTNSSTFPWVYSATEGAWFYYDAANSTPAARSFCNGSGCATH